MTRPGDGVAGTAVRARAATLANAIVRPTLPAPCSHFCCWWLGEAPDFYKVLKFRVWGSAWAPESPGLVGYTAASYRAVKVHKDDHQTQRAVPSESQTLIFFISWLCYVSSSSPGGGTAHLPCTEATWIAGDTRWGDAVGSGRLQHQLGGSSPTAPASCLPSRQRFLLISERFPHPLKKNNPVLL